MTKKEEAQAKREEKLRLELLRLQEMKQYEREANEKGYVLLAGIDEAGRGPFAGPVVAAAVILDWKDSQKEILYLNDSKKLSEKKRELLYRQILEGAVAVGVGSCGAQIIDQINILQATYRAMQQAINNLRPMKEIVTEQDDTHSLVKKLVLAQLKTKADSQKGDDCGNTRVKPDFILADAVHIPGISIPQQGIIKGDAKSVSIAAGSIVAKVTRDHLMYEYDQQYPEYGFASNKGYGTKAHIEAIREHGMLPIHRRSFIHLKEQ